MTNPLTYGEPWRTHIAGNGDMNILRADATVVASDVGFGLGNDAVRVILCVNACAGITDDELRIAAAGATLNVRLGLLAAAATLGSIRVPLSAAIKTRACEDCGTLVDVEHRACPFALEIKGDDTLHWLCDDCARERARDI